MYNERFLLALAAVCSHSADPSYIICWSIVFLLWADSFFFCLLYMNTSWQERVCSLAWGDFPYKYILYVLPAVYRDIYHPFLHLCIKKKEDRKELKMECSQLRDGIWSGPPDARSRVSSGIFSKTQHHCLKQLSFDEANAYHKKKKSWAVVVRQPFLSDRDFCCQTRG